MEHKHDWMDHFYSTVTFSELLGLLVKNLKTHHVNLNI